MSLVVDPDAFELLSGELKEFETIADSGRAKQCGFCPHCGVRIYNRTAALMSIKAGTLDDTTWLEPDAHYWTKSKQEWTLLSDNLPSFDTIPTR